jgi:DNA mismatch endonuclease, patch repair protein
MTDVFRKDKRSQIMAAVRSKGNKTTEMKLVEIFRKSEITGWRRNARLMGSPDFVFRSAKLAVFVDGCFWHGCEKHLRVPTDNQAYWVRKIARNQTRDRRTVKVLRDSGWRVLRIWEHDLRFARRVAQRLTKALRPGPARAKIRGTQKRA